MIDIEKMLSFDEGYKLTVYRCTAGFLTGGIGHNFDADPALHIMSRRVRFGDKISPDEVLSLFDYDIKNVMAGLNRRVGFFKTAPDNIKAVLINMAFQMGIVRLLKFKKMLASMQAGDYEQAALEIADSKYYTDTTSRARRMINTVKGFTPKEYLAV